MSRSKLEAMIATGEVETLPLDYGYVILTSEVERLRRIGAADHQRNGT